MSPQAARAPRLLSPLPDDCWLRVFAYLEATELCGAAAPLCAGALALADQPQLWVALLYADFCASFTQRALLRAWMAMHHRYHPRQLYVYKRQEHILDLDTARAEMQQRGEQAKEQDRKQRRLRALNFVLVRVTHLLLCACVLTSSVLLWLRLDHKAHLPFYVIFTPFFVFEAFLIASSAAAFTVYFMRGSSGWTFYWNRLRGAIRWLILYTSPWEGILVLLLACSVAPLLASALEGDLVIPPPALHLLLPFGVFWLGALCFLGSLARKRAFSASCVGSIALVWLPVVLLSVLLFLRCSVLPKLPAYAVFMPSLIVTGLLLIFVGFLVAASCWLGYRGNREWTEYAMVTLLAMITLLLPLLLFQLALMAYMGGSLGADTVFIPWIIWLSGLFLCTVWHACMPLTSGPVPPIDTLTRPWRQQHHDRSESDAELLPRLPGGIV